MTNKDVSTRPGSVIESCFRSSKTSSRTTAESMLATIRGVFERYGFEPLDTPAIEYTNTLGKFLPDLDRPHEGVFSFQDDDEQ